MEGASGRLTEEVPLRGTVFTTGAFEGIGAVSGEGTGPVLLVGCEGAPWLLRGTVFTEGRFIEVGAGGGVGILGAEELESGTVETGAGIGIPLGSGAGAGAIVASEGGLRSGSALTDTRTVSFFRGIELVFLSGTVFGPLELFLSGMVCCCV